MTVLFIIEAPGKRRVLSRLLRRGGVHDFEVEATVGHLCANPEGLQILGVDADYRETHYRVRAEKEFLAARIAIKASAADRIYLATDDDQEEDVIARDVFCLCIPAEHRHKALRLRLKALEPTELLAALRCAGPFDERAAARGDARRMIDRLIGSLSSTAGAVGRVQGSLLLALGEQRPLVGVLTHTLPAADGGRSFVAKVPVFAGQAVPRIMALNTPAVAGPASDTTLASAPMNHDQILLTASLRTGAAITDVSRAMQTLYERGRMTYPRARDCAISLESLRRLTLLARAQGAGFRTELFAGVRPLSGARAHEAPNPLVLDVPINRPFELLGLEDQVLVTITQHLVNHGIQARLERPLVTNLPESIAHLHWYRLSPVATRLYPHPVEKAGFQAWSQEQSLLHFMSKNGLGRPSTIAHHVSKFLTRDLTTQIFDLTEKGRRWQENVAALLGHRNISFLIETFIENSENTPSEIVKAMVESFALEAVRSRLEQQPHSGQADEEHEISTRLFS